MTQGELEYLGGRIAALWPKNDWTPDLYRLLASRTTRVSVTRAQIDAVVGELRATTRNRSPVVKDLIARLKSASAENTQRPEHATERRDQAAIDEDMRRRTEFMAADTAKVRAMGWGVRAPKAGGRS